MYPVSSGFLSALRSSSMIVSTRVQTTWGDILRVADGKVDMDSRRDAQRTCELELLPDDILDLNELYDLVMQGGAEFIVSRGLVVNGVPELVPLGVFATDTASRPRRMAGSIRVSLTDRSAKISRAKLTNAYKMTAGTNVGTALSAFLTDRYQPVVTDFSNVLETLTSNVVLAPGSDSDPWIIARQIGLQFGYDLAFDGLGVCRATPIPDATSQSEVFDFGAGQTSLVLEAESHGSFDETYNGVIVTAEGTGAAIPARGEAWITNPFSPIWPGGLFGKRPYFVSSSILTTAAQCQKAAETILAKVQGRREQFQWSAVVNPALVPLDVVSVTTGGTKGWFILDKLSVPLRAGESMGATARETSV